MGFSNLIAVAIIMMTAATLHAHGVTNIQSSGQAAEALQPIAGGFAYIVFTVGIIGTGLLAVPYWRALRLTEWQKQQAGRLAWRGNRDRPVHFT